MSAEPLPEAFARAVDLFAYELNLLGYEDLEVYPGIFASRWTTSGKLPPTPWPAP